MDLLINFSHEAEHSIRMLREQKTQELFFPTDFVT